MENGKLKNVRKPNTPTMEKTENINLANQSIRTNFAISETFEIHWKQCDALQ